MSFFNFNLPTTSPQLTKELACTKCGYKFYWLVQKIGPATVGLEQPACARCGNKETVDVHATRFE